MGGVSTTATTQERELLQTARAGEPTEPQVDPGGRRFGLPAELGA